MSHKDELLTKIHSKTSVIGVIGLGYVGLPLALEFAHKGFKTIGFDIDEKKIPLLNSGQTYIKHIPSSRIKSVLNTGEQNPEAGIQNLPAVRQGSKLKIKKDESEDKVSSRMSSSGGFSATADFSRLTSCDCIIICVPTPLDEHREPDTSFIENSGKVIAEYLKAGQLVTLESSTYPGTTEEILLPLFEQAKSVKSETLKVKEPVPRSMRDENVTPSALVVSEFMASEVEPVEVDGEVKRDEEMLFTSSISHFIVGESFFLAFSPEREDPNNPDFTTATIPKVVGGVTPACLEVASALYEQVIVKVVPVSSTRAAEATKLLENIYRSVNIALVNELKMVFDRMSIDVWEVIEAAKTKPFGFHAFYPGPGLGGHCIPIDPFYLTWKAREYDINTKFIELAGEINTYQPYYVVQKVIEALNNSQFSILNSKLLILGASYKKNIDDMRESPSLKLIEILESKGAEVDYYDPYVPVLPHTRKHQFDMNSIEFTQAKVAAYDLVLLSTDHDSFDYKMIAEHAKLIVDTRNAFGKRGIVKESILKA